MTTSAEDDAATRWWRCFSMSRYMMVGLCLVTVCATGTPALEPTEVLVIANSSNAASVRLARYYCQARGLPGLDPYRGSPKKSCENRPSGASSKMRRPSP